MILSFVSDAEDGLGGLTGSFFSASGPSLRGRRG